MTAVSTSLSYHWELDANLELLRWIDYKQCWPIHFGRCKTSVFPRYFQADRLSLQIQLALERRQLRWIEDRGSYPLHEHRVSQGQL